MKFRALIVFLLLLGSVGGAHGFEDSVQRYEVDFEEVWVKSGAATVTESNCPTLYPTSMSLNVYAVRNSVSIKTIDTVDFSNVGFTLRDSITNWGGDTEAHGMQIRWYDTNDVLIKSTTTFQGSTLESNDDNDRWEFVKEGDNVVLYINGVLYGTVATVPDSVGYFQLYFSARDGVSDLGNNDYRFYVDDISTSSIIGMNEEWTQASTYIDTSYGIQSYLSFPSSVYTLTSKNVGTGTTINTSTLTSQADFVRWNRTAIYGSNWGLYHVQLFRDSTKMAETTFTYFDSTISGSVAYDSDSYSQGQTANIAYTISSADFATYTYYLKTMNVAGTVKDTYTLSASSGTKSPALADYDSGVYYAILSRTSKSSGTNEEFAYDYASVTESVYINGNVTEAVSGTNMQNVSIQYLQGTTYYNATSAADGTYNVSDLSVAVSTAITANATYVNDSTFGNESYNLSSFSFTPLAAEIYTVDLILFDVNHTYDNASAYGLIYDSIYHQPIESATVNIYNATWSNSTTSTATGYYVFNDLIANGTYSINATSTGYTDTIDYSINTTTINATRQDVPMSTLYTVTIKAKDATTLAYLSDFTATLDGTEATAINGTVTFSNIEYGLHAVSAIADNYYPSATTPLIDEDTEVVLSLTRLASTYYPPHNVKFTLKSLFWTRYSGVTTNVYLGAAATGDVYKTGATGSDGVVAFGLSEDVQYTLTFIDATQGISKTITLYPVDNEYTVYVIASTIIDDLLNPDDSDQAITAINISVSKTIINANTANITINYNDIMDETTGLTFVLSQSIAGNITNRTILGTASLGTTNNTAYNFTVSNYNGQSYFIEIDLTHDTHGAISRTYGVEFENTDTRFGFTGELVGWLAIIFLTWFALTATEATVPQTAVGVCALSTILIALGWGYYISLPGLALAWVISVAANMAKSKESVA